MYSLDESDPPAYIISTILTLILGTLSFMILSVARRAYNLSDQMFWGLRLLLVAVLVGSFFFLFPSDYELRNTEMFRFPIRYGAVVIFLHLLVSYIPFINKGSKEDFWEYNKDLLLNIVEAAFYALFLFAGLAIALVALEHLFGIEIDNLSYPRLFIFLVGIFQTLYFLSKYPEIIYDNKIKKPIKAFLIFSQYILIPLVLIYMTILYAYAIKIGVNWELPKGWVSQLSLWFSVVGIFAYLLNHFNHKFSELKLTTYFRKYYFYVLLLPIALIFVAIYRRISDYGVTEPRYVVALTGVWLLGIALYFILSKEKRIRVVPMSLSVFVLLPFLLGPFGMFNSTLKSQTKKFKETLVENNVIVDGKLFPLTKKDSISEKLRENINFLDQRSDMSFINDWIENDIILLNEDTLRYNYSNNNAKLLRDTLQVNYSFFNGSTKETIYPDYYFYSKSDVIQTDDSTYFVPIQTDADYLLSKSFYYNINRDSTGIVLIKGDEVIGELILLDKLASQKDFKKNSLVLEESTFTINNNSVDATLILKNVIFTRDSIGLRNVKKVDGNSIVTVK